jgi:DNA modification methylase
VWDCDRARENEFHPTQKPVAIVERALANSSKAGDIVLDLFGGSGSTLIGCEEIGRCARLLEIAPEYCDVIIQRWQNFTGREATLDGHGATLAHVAAGRAMESEDAIKEDCLRLLEERA